MQANELVGGACSLWKLLVEVARLLTNPCIC